MGMPDSSTLIQRRRLGAREIKGKNARNQVYASIRALERAEDARRGYDHEAALRCKGSLVVRRISQLTPEELAAL